MLKDYLVINGIDSMPILGLGTWSLKGKECIQAVSSALDIGYRLIDTADLYENHQSIAKALKRTDIHRQEIFITTKLHPSYIYYNGVISNTHRFLNELGVEYIDLLLIHWPSLNIPLIESLSALNELKEKGIIRHFGVSNFNINLLKEAIDTGYPIANNQIEFHPSYNQEELVNFSQLHKISITAYSPLKDDLDLLVIQNLAYKHKKTPSQIILNWIISQNIAVIPKSKSPAHIKENFESLNFQLQEEDVKIINNLNHASKGQDHPQSMDYSG